MNECIVVRASHCCNARSPDLLADIGSRSVLTSSPDYANDGAANFVLQAILRRLQSLCSTNDADARLLDIVSFIHPVNIIGSTDRMGSVASGGISFARARWE
jgi:hypothetical protein